MLRALKLRSVESRGEEAGENGGGWHRGSVGRSCVVDRKGRRTPLFPTCVKNTTAVFVRGHRSAAVVKVGAKLRTRELLALSIIWIFHYQGDTANLIMQ
uniref:Uncharacterized protein n=1 Tax=Trichuris muris TaxID=70415 RepID=A0A5S6QC60_TRIMR